MNVNLNVGGIFACCCFLDLVFCSVMIRAPGGSMAGWWGVLGIVLPAVEVNAETAA